MIVDQRPFGACDGVFNGLQLLGDIDAWPLVFDHGDDAAQMTSGPVQTLYDGRVVGVQCMAHSVILASLALAGRGR